LKATIDELQKPVVRWYDILRRFLGRHCGGRRMTWARRNRRVRKFGFKGVSHRAVAKLSLVVDTSGSISDRLLEQFFAEIEQISHHTEVSVLMWDHGFQGFWPKYRKGDWKKIEIGGRGGTDMAAPIEWLVSQGLVGDAMIMLTDGEVSGYGPEREFPFVNLIGNDHFDYVKECPWGDNIKVDTTTMRMVGCAAF
jgi:predicted metal-dependent peptidase